MKDLGEFKIIIGQQVTKNFDIKMLKIDQSAFIRNFFDSENMTYSNIPMTTGCFINMQKPEDYKKAKIKSYQ